ncbi:MAG: GDSL-type esterase/lipase family protein [Methanoregulaceae archaeon]
MLLRHALLPLALIVALVLPVGATVTILPLGDSITRGDTEAASTSGSYRYYLYSNLTAAGYDVDFVGSTTFPDFTGFTFDQDHEGHSGYTTGTYLSDRQTESLVTLMSTYAPPDFVLLHIGTNDALQQIPLATRLANLRQVIGILQNRNPGVTVLLAQIIPTDNWYRNEKQVDPYNAALPALAADASTGTSRVLIVDQNGGFDGVADTSADGIHPNAEGMQKIASTWYQALVPLLPAPSPTVNPTLPTIPTPTQFTVPGGIGPAHSLSDDGLYQDVNGNGRADFADVVLLFNELDWCAAHAPSAFDFNANGRVDFADIVRLFETL